MRRDIVDLLSALVAIDSVNPALVPGGAGEPEIAAFVATWSYGAELDVELLEESAGRPSVLVRARGSGELDRALAGRTHPLVGRGSVHASLISGGAELSSYPARCVIALERRTLPGETAEGVEAELDALLDRCRAADPELEAERRTLLVREPFEVDAGEEIVAAIADAAGSERPAAGAGYWADSAFIAAAGIPTVRFGPAGAGAHEVEEWVDVASTETVARTLVGVAERVCR